MGKPALLYSAITVGVFLLLGGIGAPTRTADTFAAGPNPENNVTCADIWVNETTIINVNLGIQQFPTLNLGQPPIANSLLVGKSMTRSDVVAGVPVANDQTLYLGDDIPGFEPPETQFDFGLGELIPDVPPTNKTCLPKAEEANDPILGPEPVDALTQKAAGQSNYNFGITEIAWDSGSKILSSKVCTWGGTNGWIRQETATIIAATGPKAVNYGEAVLFFPTTAPVNAIDTDGDGKPDLAVNADECADIPTVTKAFPSTIVIVNRDPSTDGVPVANVIADPDGTGSLTIPQPPDGDTIADDWDGDGCTDWDEAGGALGRDPFNPLDCAADPAGVYNVLVSVQAVTKATCAGGEPADYCKGQPDGTSVTIPGTYFHCITKINKGADQGGGVFGLTGAAQCYQDSPALADASDLLAPTPGSLVGTRGERGPDGFPLVPPPPPPYSSNAPSTLAGTWNSNTNDMQLNVCFAETGGALMGPNAIWDVNMNTITTKGTVDIYRQQSIADCGDQVPQAPVHQGAPFLPGAPVQFTKQAAGFDHDGDKCTDAQELTVPQTNKCGDDPYNPFDGPNKTDMIGTYDVLTTLTRADWDKVLGEVIPGDYFNCKMGIDTQTATGDPNVDDVSGRIFCYQDDATTPVNAHDGTGTTGGGLAGSPPPYPLGEVPQKSTPQTHVDVIGTVDRATNTLDTAFCFDDAEGDASLGNVIVSSSTDIHTGLGTEDIWVLQTPGDCANLTPQGVPSAAALQAARQDDDLSTDSDGDGCTDIQEMGDNELTGGYRDPFNPFDFFDPTGDGIISGVDFFAVLGRVGAAGSPNIPLKALDPGPPNYYTSYDRGAGPVAGSNVWNTKAPDGVISGLDFFAVLGSFNHKGCDAGIAGPGFGGDPGGSKGTPVPTPTPTPGDTPTPGPTSANMSLNLPDGNTVSVGGAIRVQVVTDPSPDVAIAGFQSEVIVPTGLTYMPQACAAEVAVTHSGGSPLPVCVSQVGPNGEARHAASSGLAPPLPALDVPAGSAGDLLVEVDVQCQVEGNYALTLTTVPGSGFGAAYFGTDTMPLNVASGDSVNVTCEMGPSPTITRTPTATPTATPNPGDMAVDADGDDADVDPKRSAAAGTSFLVTVHVTKPTGAGAGGYQAYRAELRWDEPILDYLPAVDPVTENVWPQSCTAARSTQPDDDVGKEATVAIACVAATASTYTGPVVQLEFACEQEGTSQLSLVSLTEDPTNGTMLVNADGGQSTKLLTDASVNCTAPDKDGDGMLDWWESSYVCANANDPDDAVDDSDSDGQTNLAEYNAGTDPCDPDTDNDGLNDGDELKIHFTDPLVGDSDGDGLSDFDEIITYGTYPNDADTDDDGLNDGFELGIGTDPNDPYTDADTFPDGQEHLLGSDPTTGSSTPEHFSIPATCTDSVDNDEDGDTDNADSDCSGAPPPDVQADTGVPPGPDGTPRGIRGFPVTIEYTARPPAGNATITVTASNPPQIGPEKMTDVNGDGTLWRYTFTPSAAWKWMDTPIVEIVADGAPLDEFGILLIDPSGDIFDSDTLELIEGATVRLFRINPATGAPQEMDPTIHAGMFDPEVNPQTTGADGRYAWDVAAGDYFVRASKPGCSTEDSATVTIPPPVTNLDVGLTCPDTDGDGLKDHLEIEIGTNYIDRDHDADGCADGDELGSNPELGGMRDPLVFWDFFDANRDGSVSGLDFFSVLSRFNAEWEPPLTEEEALAQALETPPPAPAYHAAFDRTSPAPGADPWDTGPPDGAISGLDFFAVLAQFNTDCRG